MATILQSAASAILWRYSLLVVLLISVLLSRAPFTRASTHQQQRQQEEEQPPPNLNSTQAGPPLMYNIQKTAAIARMLRSAGYNLVARTLETASALDYGRMLYPPSRGSNISLLWNGTGTLFAPSDSAFARVYRRAPVAYNVLLYHTARRKVTWAELENLREGTQISTLAHNRCVFLCRTRSGGLCVAARNQSAARRASLRHPDLYNDFALSIHGVDAILDPAAGSACAYKIRNNSAPGAGSPGIGPVHVPAPLMRDAAGALAKSGYGVLATAMNLKSQELLHLEKVTIFAPSDEILFSGAKGFHYDFRYHVVPHRLLLLDLLRLPLGSRIDTLIPGSSIRVTGVDTNFSIDNVVIKEPEIFHNEAIVVHAISLPLQPTDNSASAGAAVAATLPSPECPPRLASAATAEIPSPAFVNSSFSNSSGLSDAIPAQPMKKSVKARKRRKKQSENRKHRHL